MGSGQDVTNINTGTFPMMTNDDLSRELEEENQKLVAELQGGASPGMKITKRTGQAKYLTPGSRFGLSAKSAKQDLLKDFSAARKPNFIKANKNKVNLAKQSGGILDYKSVMPDKVLRNPLLQKAAEAVRASANAKLPEPVTLPAAARRAAGTPSPARGGPRQPPSRTEAAKTPQPR